MSRFSKAGLAVALLLGSAPLAQADAVYGFGCFVPGASATNCAAASTQIRMTVQDSGSGTVLFLFTNAGSNASSITDVYFDDGSLLGISALQTYGQAGVAFAVGATPGNLPGAANLTPVFETSSYGGVEPHYFSADSDPAVQPNGVGPGESLGVLFQLQPGKTYADTLAAIALAGADDGLRVGLHVQGFADGGSLSVVNDLVPVPLPAAGPLLVFGLAGFAALRRRVRGDRRPTLTQGPIFAAVTGRSSDCNATVAPTP